MTDKVEYWKITNIKDNDKDLHNGILYIDGLVTLPPKEEFNEDLNNENEFTGGGLYFTTTQYVKENIDYGIYIRRVTLPSDAKFIHFKDISRADKLIMGPREDLFSPENIVKFELYKNNNFLDYASFHGKINVLEWWKNSGYKLNYTKDAITFASCNNQINALEWWKNSKYELKYTEEAIDRASENGHVNVLEWWKNSGLKFKYSEYAIISASQKGHIHVLEWWKNSGYELKYTEQAIKGASEKGHVNVLELFRK